MSTTLDFALPCVQQEEPAPSPRQLVGEEYRPALVYWPPDGKQPERWEWHDSMGGIKLLTRQQAHAQFAGWSDRYGVDVCYSAGITLYPSGPIIWGHPKHYPGQYRPTSHKEP